MAYTIMINEKQRIALLDTLKAALPEGATEFPDGLEDPNATADDMTPFAYWISMLTELPKNEAEMPGITHGFCL